jgi:hypothetical protein
MINLMVMAISILLLAVVLVWARRPSFRARIEAPKWLMLGQERRFDDRRNVSVRRSGTHK